VIVYAAKSVKGLDRLHYWNKRLGGVFRGAGNIPAVMGGTAAKDKPEII